MAEIHGGAAVDQFPSVPRDEWNGWGEGTKDSGGGTNVQLIAKS